MAQKTFKAPRHKVAPKAKPADGARKIVLVGTYKEKQLAWIRKNGVYNYPVRDGDEFDAEAFAKIGELWLYADAKGRRYCFAAEFIGKMTREEFLVAYPTYAKLGKPKNRAYYVFTVKKLDYGTLSDGQFVVTRAADFATGRGRTKAIKKAVEQFKQDGAFAPLAAYLPSDLAKVPREQLRVCEAAVQMDFFDEMKVIEHETFPFPAPAKGKFTFIDLFAGIGGIRLGYQLNGGRCVFSSEWDKDAAKTYYYNFGERPHGDIQKIDPKTIPDFDVLLAGFPCQPFSIIGDKEGFKHETQWTLFFNNNQGVDTWLLSA